jgi:hypothetical protein
MIRDEQRDSLALYHDYIYAQQTRHVIEGLYRLKNVSSPLDPTSHSTEPLGCLCNFFPKLAVLIAFDSTARVLGGVTVHACTAHVWKPISCRSLGDLLGNHADHRSSVYTDMTSVIRASTELHFVLRELQMHGPGSILAATLTVQTPSSCAMRIASRYHGIFRPTFRLNCEFQNQDIEEDTLRTMLDTLSMPCLVHGGRQAESIRIVCKASNLGPMMNLVGATRVSNESESR